jgi:hypothetical protein
VREGAIYGLAAYRSPRTIEMIKSIACNDSSAGVRASANEFLERFS